MDNKTKHFVLLHGICHEAWCWYPLVPLLESAGHRVTALDLSGSGVHPKRLEQVTSIHEYVQPLMELMEFLPHHEKVVLVGHSYGGMAISLATELFPKKISVAIYVTAFVPSSSSPPATLVQEASNICSNKIIAGGFFFFLFLFLFLLLEIKLLQFNHAKC